VYFKVSIFGEATGKLLWLGVSTHDCPECDLAKKRKLKVVPEHECLKPRVTKSLEINLIVKVNFLLMFLQTNKRLKSGSSTFLVVDSKI
jgi:hypothetical protein